MKHLSKYRTTLFAVFMLLFIILLETLFPQHNNTTAIIITALILSYLADELLKYKVFIHEIRTIHRISSSPTPELEEVITELLKVYVAEQKNEPYPTLNVIQSEDSYHREDPETGTIVEVRGSVAEIEFRGKRAIVYVSLDFTPAP